MSVYFDFNAEVCDCIIENVETIGAHSDTENMWLTANQDLNTDWLQGKPDPNSALEKALAALPASNNPSGWNQAFQKVENCFPDLNDWSSGLVIQLLTSLSQNWDTSSGSQSSLIQNAVLQQGSLIASTSSEETSTSDSEGKAFNSLVTNDASATSPFTNAGDAFSGVLGTFANAQSSISA